MSKIFLLLITLVFAARKNEVNVHQESSVLNPFKITINTNEEFLYEFDNPTIYDIMLAIVNESQKETFVANPQQPIEDFNVQLFLDKDGCFSISKHVLIKESVSFQLLNETDYLYYTDIYPNPQSNSIFLLRDDFILSQVKLLVSEADEILNVSKIPTSIDLKQIMSENGINNITLGKGLFSCSGIFCTIITHQGGFFYQNTQNLNDSTFRIFFDTNFKQRDRIESVVSKLDMIFVSAGYDGIDIYSISQTSEKEQIKYITTINQLKFINLQHVNILKIAVDEKNKILMALDENTGLHFFRIQDVLYPEYLMNIHFPRAISFDFYQETFMVVAQTVNNIEYVTELFVDLKNLDYFFNRVYIEDIPFTDIEMTSKYAILIGNDEHIFIEHSIYNKFVQKNKEFITGFEEDDLVKFEFIRNKKNPHPATKYEQSIYYVGLAKGDLKIFEVIEGIPKLMCKFTKPGKMKFNVYANASKCKSQDVAHYFTNCQIQQELEFTTKDPLVESDAALIITIIASLVCVLFLGILICLCVLNSRWLKILNSQRQQLEDQKKYKNFEEVNENSSMVK